MWTRKAQEQLCVFEREGPVSSCDLRFLSHLGGFARVGHRGPRDEVRLTPCARGVQHDKRASVLSKGIVDRRARATHFETLPLDARRAPAGFIVCADQPLASSFRAAASDFGTIRIRFTGARLTTLGTALVHRVDTIRVRFAGGGTQEFRSARALRAVARLRARSTFIGGGPGEDATRRASSAVLIRLTLRATFHLDCSNLHVPAVRQVVAAIGVRLANLGSRGTGAALAPPSGRGLACLWISDVAECNCGRFGLDTIRARRSCSRRAARVGAAARTHGAATSGWVAAAAAADRAPSSVAIAPSSVAVARASRAVAVTASPGGVAITVTPSGVSVTGVLPATGRRVVGFVVRFVGTRIDGRTRKSKCKPAPLDPTQWRTEEIHAPPKATCVPARRLSILLAFWVEWAIRGGTQDPPFGTLAAHLCHGVSPERGNSARKAPENSACVRMLCSAQIFTQIVSAS